MHVPPFRVHVKGLPDHYEDTLTYKIEGMKPNGYIRFFMLEYERVPYIKYQTWL